MALRRCLSVSCFVIATASGIATSDGLSTVPYEMDLLPASKVPVYLNDSYTSWGGSVIEVPEDAAFRFHLYVAFMVEHCSLSAWVDNSLVLHAVANDPLGPFQYCDVALQVWHHNPQIVRHIDGTFLLMSIGMSPEGRVVNCTPGLGSAASEIGAIESGHGAELVEMHSSASPYGPWTPVLVNGNNNLFNGTNPSPYVLANGTVVVASHNNCGLTISAASTWTGPYSPPVCVLPYTAYGPGVTYTFEDPFLWYDIASETWKVLLHQYNLSDTKHQVAVGGYAESATADPYSTWTLQSPTTPAYNTTVQIDNGSSITYGRRERPKVLLNATTGQPAFLYTAVCPENQQMCYTIGQAVA